MFVPSRIHLLMALPVVAWLVVSAHRAETAVISQQAKLVALDGLGLDQFGSSVAIDGDTAIVGAPYDDDLGESSGSAYIFHRTGDTWTQQAKLTAIGALRNHRVGHSVAISGDTAVVGGYYGSAAYVYHRTGTTWTQQVRLTSPDLSTVSQFGRSVSIDDDTMILGAPSHNVPLLGPYGAAYIFQRNAAGTWEYKKELLPADGVPGLQFGSSVAISGGAAIVGADPFSEATGADGAAYVFHGSGASWSQQAKLAPSDSDGYPDGFGKAVAISGVNAIGGAVVLGALHDSGAAYIFHRSGSWGQQAKLMAADGEVLDLFGQSVAISGEMAVVGAHWDDHPAGRDNAGSAYLFKYTDGHWAPIVPKLTASDRAFEDEFGYSVGISGQTIIVGARQNNASGPDSGSAYIFTETPTIPGPMVGLHPSGGDTTILGIRPDSFSVVPVLGGAGFRSLSGLDANRRTGQLFASSGYAGGDGGKLFTIDSDSGSATLVGPTGFDAVPGLAFDLDGTLFGSAATTENGDTLITIDPDTGAGTPVGPFGVSFLDSLALDPTTGILYGAGGAEPYELYTINKTNGTATSLGVFAEIGSEDELPNFIAGLAFDQTGDLYGSLGAGNGRIVSIDPSGLGPPTFAILGDAANGSVSDIAFTFIVPEPSTDGDLDEDNDVDDVDLNLLLSDFASPPSLQNNVDLYALLGNFGRTDVGALAAVESVPEPSASILLGIGVVVLLSCARRRGLSPFSGARTRAATLAPTTRHCLFPGGAMIDRHRIAARRRCL